MRLSYRAAACLLAAAALCSCAKNYAYQNTSWGMTDKAVAKARPASTPMQAAAAGQRLRFERVEIGGQKATVAYRIAPTGLADVTVAFDPVKIAKDEYIDFYRKIKQLLSEKYGSPEVDSEVMAAESKKYIIPEKADYHGKIIWNASPLAIELSCGGDCDGSSAANSVMIFYGPPVSRTAGL